MAAEPEDTSTVGAEPKQGSKSASSRRRNIATETSKHGNPLLVLKVGTSSLMVSDSTGQRVQLGNVAQLVELVSELKRRGYQVVLVSSGAVGMGCIKLGLKQKPDSLRKKQAVAAAGQSQLMRMYEDLFGTVRLQVAQLLISQSDFMDKEHWSNVKHTIMECLKLGVVPIINENDCTNTEELRFGDNDNLAAVTAVQLEADGLFLFTDVDFLYTANPRADPDAQPLRVVAEPWSLQVDTKAPGSGLGTGGMSTKIVAARTASTAGIPCGLLHGAYPQRLFDFLEFWPDGTEGAQSASLPQGTFFMPMDSVQSVKDTRRWILSLPTSGELILDDGAARAISNNKSLLPAGVVKAQGRFLRYEAVRLVHGGGEVGRAIVNFSVDDLCKILGKNSAEFEEILGFQPCTEACYRGNIVLTVSAESLRSLEGPGKLPRQSQGTEGYAKQQSKLPRNSSFS